jgi:hypothetical protein
MWNYQKIYNMFQFEDKNSNMKNRLTFPIERYRRFKNIKINKFFCKNTQSAVADCFQSNKVKKIIRGATFRLIIYFLRICID